VRREHPEVSELLIAFLANAVRMLDETDCSRRSTSRSSGACSADSWSSRRCTD
jgi:hypothetical protein